MPFRKTEKQIEATRLIGKCLYTMLAGGSNSGKTFENIYIVLARALYKKSRHVIFRKTLNAAKRSIWYETLPDVLSKCYSELKRGEHYDLNKADWYMELHNGSIVWLAGLDDGERLDKILGSRYSTILLSEASEMSYHHVDTIKSRLGEKSGLSLKMLFDCNPPSKKHWIYKLFIEKKHPEDNKTLSPEVVRDYGFLYMNPTDNEDNLPDEYFKVLDSMGRRKRDRFRDGLFSSDTEGALWSSDLVHSLQVSKDDEEPWMRNAPLTIVALDPNVAEDRKPGEEFNPDDAGIVVMSKDTPRKSTEGEAVVVADYSGQLSASEWTKKAVWAYQYHGANSIVAEKNQGGALVKNAIQAEDMSIPVVLVHASQGKHTRAEPIVNLDEKGKIKHLEGLDKLEDEMLEWIPGLGKSPNRVDARVWGGTYLFLEGKAKKAASVNVDRSIV